MSKKKESPILNIAFYPWFGFGHLTSFLHLANKLVERGHKISYFLPTNTLPKLAPHNYHPNNITFIPITVPPVDGLPPGAETTNDAPRSAVSLIMAAMDLTRDTIEAHLARLKPKIVFYDFTHWMPELGRKHGFKSVHYITSFIASHAYLAPYKKANYQPTATDLTAPPPGFPSRVIKLKAHEAQILASGAKNAFGLGGLTFGQRLGQSFIECDAFGVKSCKEMEGAYAKYFEEIFGKAVLLAGPMVPKVVPSAQLDENLDSWLKGFGSGSVIFCALGSECVLEVNQFQELVLGLELTGNTSSTSLLHCRVTYFYSYILYEDDVLERLILFPF